MALFRRKAANEPSEEHDESSLPEDDAPEELPAEVEPVAPPSLSDRPDGPWDSSELTADDATERLDLGGLQLQIPEGVELRVDLDQQGAVQAATLVHGEELMQLGCFAAPRTEPIWDEVRDEIRDSILAGGGQALESAGPFGTVLTARIPTDQPGVLAPARFIGVSGPRWFLRALVSGPLAAQGVDDEVLLQALRQVVVVRGTDAMAPRDPLPLRLPKEAQASAEAAIAAQTPSEDADAPPPAMTLPELMERGPENTETR